MATHSRSRAFEGMFQRCGCTKAFLLEAEAKAKPSARRATRGSSACRRANLAPGFITRSAVEATPRGARLPHQGMLGYVIFLSSPTPPPVVFFLANPPHQAARRWRSRRSTEILISRSSFRKMASFTARRRILARYAPRGKQVRQIISFDDVNLRVRKSIVLFLFFYFFNAL